MTENSTTPATDHGVGHIVPIRVLLTVCIALLVLTFVTVAATRVDLGGLNIWLALAIATVKASLVALYFMHLRYDHPFHGLILIAALVFVMLFVSLALLDTFHYQADINWQDAPALQRK